MPSMGPFEWMVVLIVALLLFGHKLPGIARSLGSSVNEFKKGVKEGETEANGAPQAAQQSAPPPPAPAAPAEKK